MGDSGRSAGREVTLAGRRRRREVTLAGRGGV